MKKKPYEKPSVKVYPLRQRPKLLVGSYGSDTESQNYNWHTIPEE